jgi:hypothetical protein
LEADDFRKRAGAGAGASEGEYGTSRMRNCRAGFPCSLLDLEDDLDNNRETVNNVIHALKTGNWSRLQSIRLRRSPFARKFIRAMRKNPYNFPSLKTLDVSKTDLDEDDLEEITSYLTSQPWFVRDMLYCSHFLGDREAICLEIKNSLGEDDGHDEPYWPPGKRRYETDVTVVTQPNSMVPVTLTERVPLVIFGGSQYS